MKKQIKALLGCVILVIGILAFLYAASPIRNNLRRGDFERHLVKTALTKLKDREVNASECYIAGTANGKIYFANIKKPFEILELDSALIEQKVHNVTLTDVDSIWAPYQFRTQVDSPYFYLTNGTMALFRRGPLSTWRGEPFLPDTPLSFFETMVPISNRSVILRSFSKKHMQLELAKRTTFPVPNFEFKYGILEKQIDGLLCVAGDLHYSKSLNRLVYLYDYRNEYIVIDTAMNVTHRSNTIDDNKKARLKITHIESKNSSMVNGESVVANIRSVVNDDQLFVHSNMFSKTEDQGRFLQAAAIDVYNIETGTYQYSFYIPNYRGYQLKDFTVHKGILFALYNNRLVTYRINQISVSNSTEQKTQANGL